MSDRRDTATADRSGELALLVDRLTDRLEAGEAVDLDAVIQDHPEYADELRDLLPAVAVMVGLSRSGEPGASAGTAEPLGELGDFRIVREVGRGGMGVVYEAEQMSLGRRVALKVLPYAATMDPKQLQRFKNEAKAAASLKHEHIVQVHAVGCERGVHFYAMEFVDGQTLAQVIAGMQPASREHQRPEDETADLPPVADAPVPPARDTAPIAGLSTERGGRKGRDFYRGAAELIADAADALEHAHSLGIVHRDVKPGNLLLDSAGMLYVSDFGLARFGPDAELTVSGDLLGTLRYMAPEQAMARHGLADHRVDVYGLGCTLYELLTGKTAVRGEDRADILRHIAFEDPAAPRRLDKAIPVELETVALKCLAKSPNERYATSGELAADLRRWLADKPITARRPTVRQRLARWGRRHPGLTATVGLIAGLAMAGSWAWHRETTHAETAARTVAAEADQLRDADRLPEALQAARRAADLLPRFGGDAALRRETVQRVVDLQLLNRLEEVRLEQAAEHAGRGGFDVRRGAPLYNFAFQDYGADVLGGDEADVIRALQRPAVVTQAVAVLGEWARVAADPAEKARLVRLADALDSDPRQFQSRIRRAQAAKDVNALKRLATEAETSLPHPEVLFRLGAALEAVSLFADSERVFRAAQTRYPADFWVNHHLARLLEGKKPGGAAEAIRFYTAALALRPLSGSVWMSLGRQLADLGRPAEAALALRRAIALTPKRPGAYNDLGVVLNQLGRHAEAEEAYRRAIALAPDLRLYQALYHNGLGATLLNLGRLTEAEAEYSRAIALKPDYAPAHDNLGRLLEKLKRPTEAEAAYRRAIELKANYAYAHFALGNLFLGHGRVAEAEVSFRRAIAIRPDDAMAHCNLGVVFHRQGRIEEGDAALRRAIEVSPSLARAHKNLVLSLARRKQTVAAARHFAAAIVAAPKPADELSQARYDAACAAALASGGHGQDAATLDDVERSRLRRQALDWLTAELAAYEKQFATPADQPKLQQALRHLQTDSDFVSLREIAALAALPEAEQAAWQKLWADVADLLKRVEEPRPAAKLPPP